MKTKTIKKFHKPPPEALNNEYPTSHGQFRNPMLMMVCGVRNSGKSYTASKIIRDSNDENLYDVIYMVTPTYQSNKAQFQDLGIEEENVYYPTKDSIDKVIERVETDRDDWEAYQAEMAIYEKWIKVKKSRKDAHRISDQDIEEFIASGYVTEEGDVVEIAKPEWKYDTIRKPQSLLLLDDIIGSTALNQSSGLTKLAIMNRHVAPLNGDEGGSLGLSVILLTQTYKTTNGISRAIRENCTELILFKQKGEKVLEGIISEMGGAIDPEQFTQAYNYALQDKHDNLCISFNPKCPTMRYRKNLNEFIIFDDAAKECKCKNKK